MFFLARPNWGDGEITWSTRSRTAYTPGEACEALRIGRTKFYELLADKKLKAVALGGKTLIARVEVDASSLSCRPSGFKPTEVMRPPTRMKNKAAPCEERPDSFELKSRRIFLSTLKALPATAALSFESHNDNLFAASPKSHRLRRDQPRRHHLDVPQGAVEGGPALGARHMSAEAAA